MLSYPRALLSATVALSLAVSAFGAGPAPVAFAGGSCTGWTSDIEPPPTIRVGRADGTVQVVDFRTYVGTVMAKEWSPGHPAATLEAGAVAIKQYGWYYARAGKWRRSYVNAAGECFDVRDSTADQLYRPEMVGAVDPRYWQAVDTTWGLTLRKSGNFFLTGYRTGNRVPCATDATGYRLYQRSAIDCGKIGWTREQIQLAYYAPDVTFVWTPGTEPPAEEQLPADDPLAVPISAPDADIRTDVAMGGANARVTWDAQGARPEGAAYELQQLIAGDWRTLPLADPSQPVADARLRLNKVNQFRVRLVDGTGASGPWHAGPRFRPSVVQNGSVQFTWSSGWKKRWLAKASRRSLGFAKRPGAAATFTFTGRSVALVGTRGPNRGEARVYVDGVLEAEVDFGAPTRGWRNIFFSREWAESGPHTVTVEVVGTDGRPRVDVDAAITTP